ncbi:hypothetical protein [Bacillus ndiopicus]|uniref:hypothetical protein n=1 Tax=Bacillus ndiopicus TaxID=1347368 RepID=UPI0005A94097|nr:hypothetical protein [Bacillus ndiopicus]
MKENKFQITAATVAIVIIMGFVATHFINIENTYRSNQQIIEECFQDFEQGSTITITKIGTNQPVSCEKQ